MPAGLAQFCDHRFFYKLIDGMGRRGISALSRAWPKAGGLSRIPQGVEERASLKFRTVLIDALDRD